MYGIVGGLEYRNMWDILSLFFYYFFSLSVSTSFCTFLPLSFCLSVSVARAVSLQFLSLVSCKTVTLEDLISCHGHFPEVSWVTGLSFLIRSDSGLFPIPAILHTWYNPIYMMMLIKNPLLSVKKNCPWNDGRRFPVSSGSLTYAWHQCNCNKMCWVCH